MKERPILFNGEMVRAIRDGRKTQTRRVVKPQPDGRASGAMGPNQYRDHAQFYVDEMTDRGGVWLELDRIKSPYGQPGDQLYVKEMFWAWGRWETRFDPRKRRDAWHFVDMTRECGREYQFEEPAQLGALREVTPAWHKRPSIFMPRWASRIMLEVTDVRVERLQEISEKDALTEGGHLYGHNGAPVSGRYGFKVLWRRINGPNSWDANPWVWVVEFKLVGANKA